MENNNFGRRDNSRGLEISLKKKKRLKIGELKVILRKRTVVPK